MGYTFAVILSVVWLLGQVADFTLGGFINLLLPVAVILIVVQMIQGRKNRRRKNLKS
jgi:hypothetical protein